MDDLDSYKENSEEKKGADDDSRDYGEPILLRSDGTFIYFY